MTTRPTDSPLFATDPLFTSGSEIGASVRLDPGSGVRAQGVLAESRVAARWLNYEFGLHGDWLAYLDPIATHGAMRFTRTDLVVGTSTLTKLSTVQQTTPIGAPANRASLILASGTTTLPSPAFELLTDGTAPSLLANYGAATGLAPTSAPACDASGTIFYGTSAGEVYASTTGGDSSVLQTVTGLTSSVGWVGFTASHYLVWETSTTKMYTSAALGGAWANSVLAIDAPIDLATDGAGTYVMLGTASGIPVILRSTTDGVSWTPSTLPTSTSGVGSLCYSANDSKFYLLVPDGFTSQPKLFSSTDGITWTLIRTIAALQSAGFGGQHTFACAGPALACIVNRATNSINKHPYGIAYTLDAGANWFEVYFGNPTGGLPIKQLIGANQRFYAIDGAALYLSGTLNAPAVTFTGV